jgi:hypothetical protein
MERWHCPYNARSLCIGYPHTKDPVHTYRFLGKGRWGKIDHVETGAVIRQKELRYKLHVNSQRLAFASQSH